MDGNNMMLLQQPQSQPISSALLRRAAGMTGSSPGHSIGVPNKCILSWTRGFKTHGSLSRARHSPSSSSGTRTRGSTLRASLRPLTPRPRPRPVFSLRSSSRLPSMTRWPTPRKSPPSTLPLATSCPSKPPRTMWNLLQRRTRELNSSRKAAVAAVGPTSRRP